MFKSLKSSIYIFKYKNKKKGKKMYKTNNKNKLCEYIKETKRTVDKKINDVLLVMSNCYVNNLYKEINNNTFVYCVFFENYYVIIEEKNKKVIYNVFEEVIEKCGSFLENFNKICNKYN